MTNQRHITIVTVPTVDSRSPGAYGYGSGLSLMDKFKNHYYGRGQDPFTRRLNDILASVFIWYISTTQLYVTLRYILPHYYKEYDPWTVYYLKVFMTFIYISCMANWACVKFFDSTLKPTRDNPDLQKMLWDSHPEDGSTKNGHVPHYDYDSVEKDELSRDLCVTCRMEKPYRTHHCVVCNKCILKRDHHCYMTGTCIGYYNQRFFVIMSFYMAIACGIGLWYNPGYLKATLPADHTWLDWFLPATMWRSVFGDIRHQELFMISQLYTFVWVGPMCLFFFLFQLVVIAEGKTSHEATKRKNVTCRGTIYENFRSVFGAFWLVNFIFPAVILFRQESDGKQWHNIKKF